MYYVYHYIDPRTMLPFYVGKGQGDRLMDHLKETEDTTDNRHKFYKIQYLITNGMDPIIVKIHDNITDENEAYLLETHEIMKYGRSGIDEDGILTNICLGAYPPSQKGKVKTAKHRENLSKSLTGKSKSPEATIKALETKKKNGTLKSGMKDKKHSEESKEKIRLKKTGTTTPAETKEKQSVALKNKPWSPARREAAKNQKKTGPKKGSKWSPARREAAEKSNKRD